MLKKIIATTLMTGFMVLGASQLLAKEAKVEEQSLRECTSQETQCCLNAYSGSPLNVCFYVWSGPRCIYSDGTRINPYCP